MRMLSEPYANTAKNGGLAGLFQELPPRQVAAGCKALSAEERAAASRYARTTA
jgi:hypothetical protein